MRRKIEQLLNESFEYRRPQMELSAEQITGSITEGESFKGDFQIKSSDDRRMRGFLYSGNVRVSYAPEAFQSGREQICYGVDTTGLKSGDVIEGEFVICSSIGTYRLPYCFRVEKRIEKVAAVQVADVDAFTRLAKTDYQKAYVCFLSAQFSRMIEQDYPQWIALKEGLFRQSVSYHTLEEFLVGIGAKQTILLSASHEEKYHRGLTEAEQGTVVLTKEQWGFLRIQVECEGDFIEVLRPLVTTDEFLGKNYQLDYLVDPTKMHSGKNYGSITIETYYQTIRIEITADKAEDGQRQGLLTQHKWQEKLMREYLAYRLEKLSQENWLKQAEKGIRGFRQAGGKSSLMNLYEAHILFERGKEDAACMILEDMEEHKERLNTPEILGYYLYLTTFYNKENEYIAYVEENIMRLFRQSQKAWILQWFLLALPGARRLDAAAKMEHYRSRFVQGCRSPLLYLEAYQLLAGDPLLLRRLGAFEIQVLKFMEKEQLWNGNIIIQITELAGRCKEYSGELYEILKGCYTFQPSLDLVGVICRLLIKGDKAGDRYFEWYEKAVDAELRITGLYEYYINSLPEPKDRPLPRIVKRYFSYENALDYRKRAQVYGNIIANKEADESSYESYRPLIEKFVVDQLGTGRIGVEMAPLYETFLVRAMLNKRMASHLARAIFAYELRCDAVNARNVIVVHRQLDAEQCVPITGGRALVQLYTGDAQIFIEDPNGIRHSAGIPYTLTKLLKNERFLSDCQTLVPENPGLLLHQCGAAAIVNQDNVQQFFAILDIEGVREKYKQQVRKAILTYFHQDAEEGFISEYMAEADYESFILADKQMLIERLIVESDYQQAFGLVAEYGPEGIAVTALVRMCSRYILLGEYVADEMLIALCYYCFEQGKYDEVILAYLLKYYDGPVRAMKALWRAGQEFGLEAYELEEKILMMVLFTGEEAGQTEAVFDSYRRKMGKKPLLLAYVIWRANDYFVREMPVEMPVFRYIERGYRKGKLKRDICLLALLKWYSTQEQLPEEQQGNAMELMETYICRHMYFSFYQNLALPLQRVFGLHDKSFIEYRSEPDKKVILKYYLEDGPGRKGIEHREIMKHVYQGIYVAEFTLFYGERIVYSIDVEEKGTYVEKTAGICERRRYVVSDHMSKYDMLNKILNTGDKTVVQNYLKQECLIEELFTLD